MLDAGTGREPLKRLMLHDKGPHVEWEYIHDEDVSDR